MLAGRTLLLADDSITIQKVVQLTFADEGVTVVVANNGKEAIEKLGGVAPDIVLADVFMPLKNGYEVCEYIRQNARLKHIPVMLLVGSFEPFDEAEARRVGADDILTKPFQSIRRLIDKVGKLVTGKTAGDDAQTAEFPSVAVAPAEPEKLSTEELEITTADTQPFSKSEPLPDRPASEPVPSAHVRDDAGDAEELKNEIVYGASSGLSGKSFLEAGEELLDLGDIGQASDTVREEFVWDLDLDEVQHTPVFEASSPYGGPAFIDTKLPQTAAVGWEAKAEHPQVAPGSVEMSELANRNSEFRQSAGAAGPSTFPVDQFPASQNWTHEESSQSSPETIEEGQSGVDLVRLERVGDESRSGQGTISAAAQINLKQLSPEVIDAIARRTVEHLSEKVVKEIAWEVVPQLAELLIKRKLKEQESHPE